VHTWPMKRTKIYGGLAASALLIALAAPAIALAPTAAADPCAGIVDYNAAAECEVANGGQNLRNTECILWGSGFEWVRWDEYGQQVACNPP
jgi:hypothetical protein